MYTKKLKQNKIYPKFQILIYIFLIVKKIRKNLVLLLIKILIQKVVGIQYKKMVTDKSSHHILYFSKDFNQKI